LHLQSFDYLPNPPGIELFLHPYFAFILHFRQSFFHFLYALQATVYNKQQNNLKTSPIYTIEVSMNLYPRNTSKVVDPALFQNPTAEYRGTPFWSWNGVLKRSQLKRQVDVLKAMGMGGYHIHVRTGLTLPYLGDEFMGFVSDSVEWARQE
jgi:hypothetical protein